MNKRKFLCCLFLSSTAALAQAGTVGELTDLWTGPYFGTSVEAGAGRGSQSLKEEDVSISGNQNGAALSYILNRTNSSANLSGSTNGGLVNLFAGYNARSTYFIYGIQFSGNIFNSMELKTIGQKHSSTAVTQFNNGVVILNRNVDQTTANNGTRPTELINLAGRIGILTQPTTLLYGLLGASGGRFLDNQIIPGFSLVTLNVDQIVPQAFWKLGLLTGAGVEHKFTDHWSILAEYHFMYFNFNKEKSTQLSLRRGPTINPPGVASTFVDETAVRTTHTNFNFNSAAIGIVYRI